MISPGTIKAASLINKGMSPEAALREANRIDILTESRRTFLKANPSTAVDVSVAPSAVPSTTVPSLGNTSTAPKPVETPKASPIAKGVSLGNISSSVSDIGVKPSKDFTKDEVDAINKVASSVENPKVRKQMSLGNPMALADSKNMSEGLSKLSSKQLGQLSIDLQTSLIQSKIDSLPTNISKSTFVPDSYKDKDYGTALVKNLDKLYTEYNEGFLESPFTAAMMQAEHKKKLSSYQSLSNQFLKAKDFDSLKAGYDALEKELKFIDETATKDLETATRKYRSGTADFSQVALVNSGALSLEKTKNKKKALLEEIATVYNQRANAMLAKEATGIIKERYEKAKETNPDLDKNKFFESLTKQYSLDKTPFGLGQLLVESGRFNSYQDYIRFTNPTKYSKRFTPDDPSEPQIDRGGIIPAGVNKPEDVSSWALELSKIAPAQSSITKDYRYRNTKQDLLFTGLQFSARVSEELYQESINKIREREQLTLDYNKKEIKGILTKEDKAKYEQAVNDLNEEIEYSSAFDKAMPSIYNYENLKKNSVYKNFAKDESEFLEKEQSWNKAYNSEVPWYKDFAYSRMYSGYSGKTKALFQEIGSRVAKSSVGTTADILQWVDQTVVNKFLGVPQSSNYHKRNAYYNSLRADLEVPEIIDERATILAGRPVTASEFFWKEKGASWYDLNFNPRAILTGAAQTLPQMWMFASAGKGIQSLAGSTAKAGLTSGTTAAIFGEKTAATFANALQKTGSTANAWSYTFKQSNNLLIKSLADKIPYGLGVATVAYPEAYNRNLERLEAMGVKDAPTIARNVAGLTTLIEVVSESAIPNIGYVENLAEKGTGAKKLLGKLGLEKWIGSVDQYRALYSGVLGNNFSENTIKYLARNSAELFGQAGSVGRLYASRGFEEGLEEVFSEITNGLLDNYTSFGAYKQDQVKPLELEDILNAFAGGFFVPTSGAQTQVKAYKENKKYTAMYDMMVNADYYRNKINQQFKQGSISEKQAAEALAKLQEITAIADEFGVQNLKRRTDAAQFTADLVDDPEKQFDYFKQILKVKGIEDTLAKQGTNLKDEEKKNLLAEAEEATKRIDKYQKQASYFGNLTDEQRDEIVNNTIREKTKKARFETPSEILAEAVVNADIKLAEAIREGQPKRRIDALKNYRNSLQQISEDRASQKQRAVDNNTYNPIIAAVASEGEPIPLDLSNAETYEDLVDLVSQAMLDPEKGSQLYTFLSGRTSQELEELEQDRENLLENFLDYLEQNQATPTPENQKSSEETTADNPVERVKYRTIADLSDEQQDMFTEIVEEMEEEYQNKKAEVEKYEDILNQLNSYAALKLNLSIEQQETFFDEVFANLAAVKKVGFSDAKNTGAELFDTQAFDLYKANNKDKLDKVKEDFRKEVEELKKKDQLEREEVSLDTLGNVTNTPSTDAKETITVPELVPTDLTPEFSAAMAELEQIAAQTTVEIVENTLLGTQETITNVPVERARVLNTLLEEIAKNPELRGAQAMMAAVMQVLEKPIEEIQKTLNQMADLANGISVPESQHTHLFGMYQSLRTLTKPGATDVEVKNAAEDLGVAEDLKETKDKIERKRDKVRKAISKAGQGEGGQFTVTLVDGTKENAVRASLVGDELAIGSNGVLVDLFAIKKVENPDGTVLYDEELEDLESQKTPTPSTTTTNKPQATESDVAQQQNQSKVLKTSTLYFPNKNETKDIPNFRNQSRIIRSINKEVNNKKDVQTGIVDLFTMIEEVLGEEALENLQRIFNQATKPGATTEEINSAKKEFVGLFPPGFLRFSVMRYMFNTIMIEGTAQSNVNIVGKEKLDATDNELLALNRNKKVSIVMADGRKFPEAWVRNVGGSLFFVVDKKYTGGDKDLFLSESKNNLDRTKDKITGLVYPKVEKTPIQFSDLNVLVFTVFDKNGKVQKYSEDGNRNDEGNLALLLYLPTSKNDPNPTELQKAFNGLRNRIVAGERVKVSTPLTKGSDNGPLIEVANPDGTKELIETSYSFDFYGDNIVGEVSLPTETQKQEQQKNAQTLSNKFPVAQQSTIDAVEKFINESKNIPEPTKEGYLINGKLYERQSNFVKRVLGDKSVDTEQSIINKEMGAAVGNFLDIVGRDVLGGAKVKTLAEYLKEVDRMNKPLRKKQGYSLLITEVQFKQLLEELNKVKEDLTKQGWKLYTEGLIVHREFSEAEKAETGFEGIAGAMDILAVDPSGNVHIIDFKNKKYTEQEKFVTTLYTSKAGYSSNVSKWSTQQTVYASLGGDFGLPVQSISILAFASDYIEDSGLITINELTLASNKAPVSKKHISEISPRLIRLNYDPKIIKHLELRTSDPAKQKTAKEVSTAPKDKKSNQPPTPDLNKVQENLPETTKENAESVFDVLNSLGIDINDIPSILPSEGSIDPDILNNPPCS